MEAWLARKACIPTEPYFSEWSFTEVGRKTMKSAMQGPNAPGSAKQQGTFLLDCLDLSICKLLGLTLEYSLTHGTPLLDYFGEPQHFHYHPSEMGKTLLGISLLRIYSILPILDKKILMLEKNNEGWFNEVECQKLFTSSLLPHPGKNTSHLPYSRPRED